MRSPTSSGERRRICTSFKKSQRIGVPSMTPVAQEANERSLEVTGVVPHRLAELTRRSREQELTVPEHDHAAGVALDLSDVAGGEDDGRPPAGQAADELP